MKGLSDRPFHQAHSFERESGVIVNRAVLIALGIEWEGRRQVWAVVYAQRESLSSSKEFLCHRT